MLPTLSQTKKRSGTSINVYLILKQQDKILLQLRKNTGYCDGMWSLVSGHVEDDESATAAMIREAYEEIGIHLDHIHMTHVMHRKTNRLNMDLFFDCLSWHGILQNREPDKCENLAFFSPNNLPPNTIDCTTIALNHILKGIFYSELGWLS